MCVSVWFVSFFLSLGVARYLLPLGRSFGCCVWCFAFFVYAFCSALLPVAMCVFGSCCNAHIIVIIYLALWIVRTEISLLRVYVCARGCSRLFCWFVSTFFFSFASSLLSLFTVVLFFYFFSYSLLVRGIHWDPYEATHIARAYWYIRRGRIWLLYFACECAWFGLRYHFYKMWCKRDTNKSYK